MLLLLAGKCATLKCSTGEWGEWLGDLPVDGCTLQTRIKPVTSERDTIMQENDCEGVQLSCKEFGFSRTERQILGPTPRKCLNLTLMKMRFPAI